MIAGSFASSIHGKPRTTQDLDVVIDVDCKRIEAFVRSLPREEWYADVDAAIDAALRRSLFDLVDMKTGWKVDLVVRKERAFSQEEFWRRRPMDALGVTVPVATAEDTIIAKLEWSAKSGGAERQRRDIRGSSRLAERRSTCPANTLSMMIRWTFTSPEARIDVCRERPLAGLYWMVPLAFWMPVLNACRKMAEHGAIRGHEGDGNGTGTRTTITGWLERAVLQSTRARAPAAHAAGLSRDARRLACLARAHALHCLKITLILLAVDFWPSSTSNLIQSIVPTSP